MKRILLIVLAIMMVPSVCFALNFRTSGNSALGRFQEASVVDDPGTAGYGCNAVSIQTAMGLEEKEIWFYVKSIGTNATITLQWSDDLGVTYYDYPTTRYDIETGGRDIIRDSSAGVYWRLIVKDSEQGSSGASVFGISW